jgi:hypothetical protein
MEVGGGKAILVYRYDGGRNEIEYKDQVISISDCHVCGVRIYLEEYYYR